MSISEDGKIASLCLASIKKAAMDVHEWKHTLLGQTHPQLVDEVDLAKEELPIVSCFISPVSWYLLTSRRVLGAYYSHRVTVSSAEVLRTGFGNFKGHGGGKQFEVATIATSEIQELRIEYEAGKASMAPIYYFQFWSRKYPHLSILVP